jgi:hypothetical protein
MRHAVFCGTGDLPREHPINTILAAALGATAFLRLYVMIRDGSGYHRVRSTAGIDPPDRLRNR